MTDTTNAIEYANVAKLAYDTVHEVMRQGEADGKSGWEGRGVMDAVEHAELHLEEMRTPTENVIRGYNIEKDYRHALTRCAMAYYLWLKEGHDERKAGAV